MKEITVICDRCDKNVEGIIEKCPDTDGAITSGYYVVAEGSAWHEYARWGEEIVCDECMHADPKYIKIYLLE